MSANTATVKIALEVDDNGSVKVRQFGAESEEAGGKTEKSFKRGGKSISDFNSKIEKSISRVKRLTAVFLGFLGLETVAGKLLGVASSFEQMEMKLDVLTRGKGPETLEKINAWALKMPVNTKEAVNSFVMMMAMGLNPTIEKMKILVNVASLMGDEAIPRVSRALGQMKALGKLSAEELNQLSEVGINARKYLKDAFGMTVEEIQKSQISIDKIIDVLWKGLDKQFKGGSEAAMKTWAGMWATFKSYATEISRQFFGYDLFEALKSQLADLDKSLGKVLKDNKDEIREFGEAAMVAADALLHLGKIMLAGGVLYIGLVGLPALLTGAVVAFSKSIFALHVGMGLLANKALAIKSAVAVAMAAFAGWELGTWAYENFENVRLMGVGLVDGLIGGWIEFEYMVKKVLERIKSVFKGALILIRNQWIKSLEIIANAMSKIPFMKDATEALRHSISELRKANEGAVNGTELYEKAIQKLNAEKTEALLVHKGIISSLVDQAINYGKAGDEAEKTAKSIENVTKSNKDLAKSFENLSKIKPGPTSSISEYHSGMNLRNLSSLAGPTSSIVEHDDMVNLKKEFADTVGDGVASGMRAGIEGGIDGALGHLKNVLFNEIEKGISTAVSNAVQQGASDSASGIGQGAGAGVVGGIYGAMAGLVVGSLFGGGGPSKRDIAEKQHEKNIKALMDNTRELKRGNEFLRIGEQSSFTADYQALAEGQSTYLGKFRDQYSIIPQQKSIGGRYEESLKALDDVKALYEQDIIDMGSIGFKEVRDFYDRHRRIAEVGLEKLELSEVMEGFNLNLGNIKKGIKAGVSGILESAGDAFRSEAEIQKREFNKTAKNSLVGLAGSYEAEGLISADYLDGLSKMNDYKQVGFYLLSALTGEQAAWNEAAKRGTDLLEADSLQRKALGAGLTDSVSNWQIGLTQDDWRLEDWTKEFDRLGSLIDITDVNSSDYYGKALEYAEDQFSALQEIVSISERQLDTLKNTKDSLADQLWDVTKGSGSDTVSNMDWTAKYDELYSAAVTPSDGGEYDTDAISDFQAFIPEYKDVLMASGYSPAQIETTFATAINDILGKVSASIGSLTESVKSAKDSAPSVSGETVSSGKVEISLSIKGRAISDVIIDEINTNPELVNTLRGIL